MSDFEALGWTNLADAFTVGTVTLPEGVQCTWGDLAASAEQVQQFGWAPITAALAAHAQQDLLAEGWREEKSPEGVYITESADTAAAKDDEGYGRTYLFGGDGTWVKYADTKQSLLLVQFPPSPRQPPQSVATEKLSTNTPSGSTSALIARSRSSV